MTDASLTTAAAPGAASGPREDMSSAQDEGVLLNGVCRLLVTALPVATAAVALVDERLNPMVVASWPDDLRDMVLAQFERAEGPCFDVCRSGQPVAETHLADAGSAHWTQASDWRSVNTVPVLVEGRPAGSITLGSEREGGLTGTELELAGDIAAIAAAHVATWRALRGSKQVATELADALHGRLAIEQAKGALAQRLDITVDEAFDLLDRHARTHSQELPDVAAEVLADREIITMRPEFPAAGAKDPLSILETSTPGRVRLIGEADLATLDELDEALGRLAAHLGDVTLDLAELEFLDAGSVGSLLRAATALPPGRRLVLAHPRGVVAKVLVLLDVAAHQRVTITDDEVAVD